jgi:hypothetical protein
VRPGLGALDGTEAMVWVSNKRLSRYRGKSWEGASSDNMSDASERFLLAEYDLISNMRAAMLHMVENRITFVTGLQASEIALIALLFTSKKVNATTLLTLVCALGIPTLFLTYIVFLRALDMQVTGRRYLHALNAIRRHFVTKYPHIKDAVRLPTVPDEPRYTSIGSHSSILLSMAATMLIITVALATILATSISWFALRVSKVTESHLLISISITVAVISFSTTSIGLTIKMNRFLRRAEVQGRSAR